MGHCYMQALISRRALFVACMPVASKSSSSSPLIPRWDQQAARIECNFADLMAEGNDGPAYATSLLESHKELMRMVVRAGPPYQADMRAMQRQLVLYDVLIQERWPELETYEHLHSV